MDFQQELQDLIGRARVSSQYPLDEILGVMEQELAALEEIEAGEDDEE